MIRLQSFARWWLRALCAAGLVTSLAAPAVAQDWSQWRGPQRDGSAAVKLPDAWPENPKPLWQVEVGEGYAGPVVAGDRVVVFGRQGEEEAILCLSAADGKTLWRYAYAAPYTPARAAQRHGKGPFATPAIAAGKVYTFGSSGILTCTALDTGRLVWQKESAKEFNAAHPQFGASNSPLIEGGLCILEMGAKGGALAAFKTETGELAWKVDLDGAAYASPVVADVAGERQVLALTEQKVIGVAAGSGKLLWEADFPASMGMNIVTPIPTRDGVLCFGRRGATSFGVARAGDRLAANVRWQGTQAPFNLSTPVVAGDSLYGLSQANRGTLVCLSLQDGTVRWSAPDPLGDYASLVSAGDRLLVMKADGEVLVVAANPAEYKELGRRKLADTPVWSHVAVTGDRLYVKSQNQLAAFALAGQ